MAGTDQRSRKLRNRVASLSVAVALSISVVSPGYYTAHAAEGSSFKTQAGGVYDGMPLFDGNPDHLNAFVDTYFDYIGLEGAALYATGIRDNYTFVMDDNPNKGKTVPGGIAAADNPYGVSTDFASLLGLGQTWNKELATQVGQVMGSEKISQLNVKQGTSNIHNGSNASKPIAFTAITDLRVNPLNGRYAEGYGEDPFLTATMVDSMSAGLAGTNQDESNNGFWQRAIVGTRHFSLYNAEWFRQTASYNASARGIYEYHATSAFKALESGSLSGAMTAFGRTNGIPNLISPYMLLGNKVAKYGMYSSPDFNAENHTFASGSMGNGYDTKYTLDRKHILALMVLARSESTRASGTDKTDVVTLANAVKEGLYGITLQDVQDAGRPLINQLVRIGVFNEVDANGVPKNYPFANQAKDVASTLTDYNTAAHQEIAKQEARETVVLLKNTDVTLPLSKTEKAAVGGLYADTRIVAQNGLNTPNIAEASKSPLYSVLNEIGADHVQYATGNEVIALKSKLNGQYLSAGTGVGSQLVANYTPADNQFTDAQLFDVADWGQNATSLQSKANGYWAISPSANSSSVSNTSNTTLYLTDSNWATLTAKARTSTIPPKLRIETNSDQSISMIANGLGFQTGVFSGRYIKTASDGKIATDSATIGNMAAFNTRADDVKYEKTVVKETGADIAAMANTQDYALLFVGADPRNSASEGNDRASLYLGANDYKLVKNVAAAFAAKNKKTIVVVLANSPVIVDEIQKDPNVSAIITQPYSGEFDSQGLVDVLYGDYAPTGRLTSTWYADMSALPNIDKYDIPEGNTTITSLDQLDPRYTKDMFDADPVQTKLTYMYTSAPVTYPFGYGLGYSEFTYSNFSAPSAAGSNKFNVAVEITNEGSVATSEVVQLYAKHNNSSYDGYAPSKKLVAYEKVDLTAGEHKIVNLTVDPKDLAIWDVNKGDYVLEKGSYSFMAGHSSADIRQTATIQIAGDTVASVKGTDGLNVFDHSFASNGVVYREASKQRTADNLKAQELVGGYYAVMSKGNGSWTAIPNADFTGAMKISAKVATNVAGGNITLRADSPTAEPFATIPVPVTDKVTYTMQGAADQTVNELGYVEQEVNVTDAPAGLHTVYVVFDAPDLRIDSLSVTETAFAITKPLANAALPSAVPGVAYDQALELEATGGKAPYTWTVTGLPEGLSFDADTKKITGTVDENASEASPYTLTITATDANGAAVSVTNTLAVRSSAASGVLSGPNQVNSGAAFDVKYGLAGVNTGNVLAEDVTVTYDASKMDFVSVASLDEEKYLVVGQQPDAAAGKLRFLGVRLGDAQTNPNGDLVTLKFKAKRNAGAGIANISISNLVIADEEAHETSLDGSTLGVQINVIDRTALETLINEAQNVHGAAVEGTKVGQYPVGSKAALQAAIDSALNVLIDDNAGTVDMQAAVTALNSALQAFKDAKITSLDGDSNGDNNLTVGDLAIVAKAYGAKSTDANWNSVKSYDRNNDGKIDIEDLVWLAVKILNA
ncbi:glycoside hydrolase family 3 C-terminal domain-containing protein [Paenibacillus glycanilyticus]|uniref:glycoside hydrolase family 3 C-terminal domain-containing protein n=1 Tax=Paenibacillus glycanilyticus TaxID=126569 RepID=UPI000FD9DEF2|nr:glycoside hydrolase family 3 C-terminal domain-containing protein [Paenibacillus glycanilyticus]